MPNPFMRSVQENTSDEGMTPDRPHPTDPILETYSGSNHPYRGIEQHGVSDTVKPDDPMPEWPNGTRAVVYAEEKHVPDPIPVKIVTEGGREFKSWRVRQFPVDPLSIPRQVVSANPRRTSLRIKNTAAFTVYIGEDNNIATYTGYPLAASESLDLDIHGEVWVLNPDLTNLALIGVIEYLSLPID